MPKMLIESDTLENIADAIRDRTGENESYSPADMPEAIRSIQGTSVPLTFDDTPTQGSNNPVKSGGIYNALQNLNIPDAPIQSDWEQEDNTKLDYIKNKPDLSSIGVQANWNETNTTSLAYIKNKPDLTTLLAAKQNKLTFDKQPVQGSNNVVTSGGIYTALSNKQQDLTQIPIVSSILPTDYLFIERNGTVYRVLASVLLDGSSESGSEALTGENGESILTENGDELLIDTGANTSSSGALSLENGQQLLTENNQQLLISDIK